MYSRGDLVYLYMFDVKKSINKLKKLNKTRFGKIKSINKVELGNKTYNEVTIELLDNKNIVTIKEYVAGFSICNISTLQSVILESSELTDNEKDKLIQEVQEVLESVKAK